MRLDDQRESSNFEVQGSGGGGGGGLPILGLLLGSGKLGFGAIILIGIAMLVMGINPLTLLGGGGGSQPQVSRDAGQLTDQQRWSLRVLGSTEDVWTQIFAANGQQYPPTTLVFYTQNGMSGCGAAQSAMGPFYCPSDQRVYLDLQFFDELKNKFGAAGDFAQAYVIAHEVGHHIQTITGISARVREMQQRGSEAEGNAAQVKMELQADCYAGVWAAVTGRLQPGDIEEGMTAARAIGDDTLQKSAGRVPVPESFTHGTSAQRMEWLKRGLESRDPAQCDTFAA